MRSLNNIKPRRLTPKTLSGSPSFPMHCRRKCNSQHNNYSKDSFPCEKINLAHSVATNMTKVRRPMRTVTGMVYFFSHDKSCTFRCFETFLGDTFLFSISRQRWLKKRKKESKMHFFWHLALRALCSQTVKSGQNFCC